MTVAMGWTGVDLSTHKIAFVRSGDDPYMCEVISKGKLAEDRFEELMRGAFQVIQDLSRSNTFVIEDVPFMMSRIGGPKLVQVLGGLRGMCLAAGVPHVVVAGRDWKRGLGLSGNAGKPVIREWVRENALLYRDTWSQDLCDAFAIGAYGGWLGGAT